MNFTEAVIYQPKQDIAGVRPYFVLPRQEDVAYFDSRGGAPEAELITWALQFVDQGDRGSSILDIGSHIGTWGITFATAGYDDVVCFEAQPWLAHLNRAGAALNGLERWSHTCQSAALWNDRRLLTLQAPYADGGGGSVVVITADPAVELEVQAWPLDTFHYQPRFMKIDVEGAELEVLRGAKTTIDAYKPTILFESWVEERGQNAEETFRYLHDILDYRTVNVNGWPEMWLAEPKS